MKKYMWVVLACAGLLMVSRSVAAQEAKDKIEGEQDLYLCTDKSLGIKMVCHPDWMMEDEDNAINIIVSENPQVVITVSKARAVVLSLDKLNDDILQALGEYADGFTVKRGMTNGRPTIRVDGELSVDKNTRVRDYYWIYDYTLYGLAFSVTPPEAWDRYLPLFETSIKHFSFLR